MAEKEAKARIKINKLLEDAGWRFFDTPEGNANILLENNVKLITSSRNDFGEDFVPGMGGTLKKVTDLNAEQQALKARVKEKTTEVDSTLTELKGQISEAGK
jgi:hypothetical protein